MSVEEDPTEEWSFRAVGPKNGLKLVPESESPEPARTGALKLLAVSPNYEYIAAASSGTNGELVLGRTDDLHRSIEDPEAEFRKEASKHYSEVLQIVFLANSRQLVVATRRQVEILNVPELSTAATLKLDDDFLDIQTLQATQGFVYATTNSGVTKVTAREECKVADACTVFAVLQDDTIMTSQSSFGLPDSAGEIKWIGEVAQGQLGVVAVDAEDDDEHLFYIQNGTGLDEWLLVPDACPPNADESRPWAWFSSAIPSYPLAHEHTVVAACSQSTDLLLFAQGKKITPLDDSDKLPFTSEDEDISPQGVAMDLSSSMTVYTPVKGVDSASKLPLLLLLSQESRLLVWAVASKTAISKGTFARPRNLASSAQVENIESLEFKKNVDSGEKVIEGRLSKGAKVDQKDEDSTGPSHESKKASISEEDVEEISLEEASPINASQDQRADSKPGDGKGPDSSEKDAGHDPDKNRRPGADTSAEESKELSDDSSLQNSSPAEEVGIQSTDLSRPDESSPLAGDEAGSRGLPENRDKTLNLQADTSPLDSDSNAAMSATATSAQTREEGKDNLEGSQRAASQFSTSSTFKSSWGGNSWASAAKDGSLAQEQLHSKRFGPTIGSSSNRSAETEAPTSQVPEIGGQTGKALTTERDSATSAKKEDASNQSLFTAKTSPAFSFAGTPDPFSLTKSSAEVKDSFLSTSSHTNLGGETVKGKDSTSSTAERPHNEDPAALSSPGDDAFKTQSLRDSLPDPSSVSTAKRDSLSSDDSGSTEQERLAPSAEHAKVSDQATETKDNYEEDVKSQVSSTSKDTNQKDVAFGERMRSLASLEWQGDVVTTFADFATTLKSSNLDSLELFDGVYAETNVLFQVLDQNLKVLENFVEYDQNAFSGDLERLDLAEVRVGNVSTIMEANVSHFEKARVLAERSSKVLGSAMDLMNSTEKLGREIDQLQSELDLQSDETSAEAYRLRPLSLAHQIIKRELHKKLSNFSESLKAAKLKTLLVDVEKRGIADRRGLIVAIETVDSRLKLLERRFNALEGPALRTASGLAALSLEDGGHRGALQAIPSFGLSKSLMDEEVEAVNKYLKIPESCRVEDLTTLASY